MLGDPQVDRAGTSVPIQSELLLYYANLFQLVEVKVTNFHHQTTDNHQQRTT